MRLEVIIKPNKEGHYTHIFLTIYRDGEMIDSDFCQTPTSSVTYAKQFVKDMYKGKRFSEGRKFIVDRRT